MQDKWKAAYAAAKHGNFDEIPSDMRVRYYSTWKKIAIDEGVGPPSFTHPDQKIVLWYYGKTGTGKSRSAREEFGDDIYIKDASNRWWCGYNHQETVLIEDFDIYHIKQGYYLKIWTDMYNFSVETKQGKMIICPKRVIITSNYRIREIWADPRTYEPLERRCSVVHFKKLGEESEPHETEREAISSSAFNFNIPPPL